MNLIFSMLFIACGSFSLALQHPDEIIALPGLHHRINFKQYSGFLNVTPEHVFHYWFLESQRSPSTDPVVLWLNGGPGCSSLGGLLTENGPFYVKEDGKTLIANHYSWNKVSNVLYLESPAGTGFSYTTTPMFFLDDNIVAEENYIALQKFLFEKFPQFSLHDIYIAGESYAGMYIPSLSVKILDGPAPINLKGFMIGNGCLDENINSNSLLFFAYYHGFIGTADWNRLVVLCCDDNMSPYGCDFQKGPDPRCRSEGLAALDTFIRNELNSYNVFETCSKSANIKARYSFDHQRLLQRIGMKEPFTAESYTGEISCLEAPNVHHYLNRDSVRQALHIPKTVQDWLECNNTVMSNYKKNHNTVKDEILHLVNSGRVRGLVYNGDSDLICNFLGDEWFVQVLGLEVVKPYTQWKYDDQIAGFVIYYKNLAFLTIKGSGHMVPHDKPGAAFQMFSNFLDNISF